MADDTPIEDELSREQQQKLLTLARETIDMCLTTRKLPPAETSEAIFLEDRAVFVTLHLNGRLRGCIGTLEAHLPLGEAVREYAVAAATQDPRFRPVSPAEVPHLELEISVLSPMRRVASPDEIQIGKHGVCVRRGSRSGVFLPQVAPEQGWDLETTLTTLCVEKAGLPGDAWKTGAEILCFTAQVFGEGD